MLLNCITYMLANEITFTSPYSSTHRKGDRNPLQQIPPKNAHLHMLTCPHPNVGHNHFTPEHDQLACPVILHTQQTQQITDRQAGQAPRRPSVRPRNGHGRRSGPCRICRGPNSKSTPPHSSPPSPMTAQKRPPAGPDLDDCRRSTR